MHKHIVIWYGVRLSIDGIRGACAVKGKVQVAGHVKRVDHGDTFDALLLRKETLTGHYFILKFDFFDALLLRKETLTGHYFILKLDLSSIPIWKKSEKLREYFSICNVIVTQSSFYIYKTDQSPYQCHLAARFDSAI